MFKDMYDLHAEKKEFISPISNRRNVYLQYNFKVDQNDVRLVFIETDLKGRKLTSVETEERAKIFQWVLDKHKIDADLRGVKVFLVVNDGLGKPYGYRWDNGNFSVNPDIIKLDHEQCETILKQLEA